MAVTALILFNQGGPGTAGQAFLGTVAGGLVTVTNNSNVNITAWTITLLDVPPGSALVAGTVLGSASNNTPTATFTPDVPGSYRILLSVTDGTLIDKDIRNFGIKNARGFLVPSYQKLPDPLPVQGSGLPGQKPDEQNYGGQLRGWTGNRTDGQLEQFFLQYDDLPFMTISSTPFSAAASGEQPLYFINITGAAVFNLPSGARVGQHFRVEARGTVTLLTVNPPGGHTIGGLSVVVILGACTGDFVYRGGTSWSMIGCKKDIYERTIVAATEDTNLTGFSTIGSTAINPSDYPNTTLTTWQAILETTLSADAAEIRLFNVTTSLVVTGSVLSTTSLTPVLVSSTITLASGLNIYEAQLRLQTTGDPDRATCKQAQVIINWLQP